MNIPFISLKIEDDFERKDLISAIEKVFEVRWYVNLVDHLIKQFILERLVVGQARDLVGVVCTELRVQALGMPVAHLLAGAAAQHDAEAAETEEQGIQAGASARLGGRRNNEC